MSGPGPGGRFHAAARESAHGPDGDGEASALVAIAVDGKTVRDATDTEGNQGWGQAGVSSSTVGWSCIYRVLTTGLFGCSSSYCLGYGQQLGGSRYGDIGVRRRRRRRAAELGTGLQIGKELARDAMRAVDELNDGRERPLFVDMTGTAVLTRDARQTFAVRCSASRIALVGRSAVDRVIANFALGVSSVPVPTNFFTSESAAMDWLRDGRSDL